MLNIFFGCLLSVLVRKLPTEFQHAGDVVALIFMLGVVNPFMDLPVGLSGPLSTDLNMFFDGGHTISPSLLVVVL
jgi:hypothetical protein